GAGGLRQAAQLVQRVGADERPVRQRDADEEGFFQLDVEFFARGIERHWGYYLLGDVLLYARGRLRREVNLPLTGCRGAFRPEALQRCGGLRLYDQWPVRPGQLAE